MRIAPDRVVAIDYTIRLDNGRTVESTIEAGEGPLVYLHGRSQIVPGVEGAIEGAEPGEVLELEVDPEDAYGPRDPAGVFVVPRSSFPDSDDVGPGMTFSATRSDGTQMIFHVVEANGDLVVIDTNHPLAGERLYVSVAVRGVREASYHERSVGKVIEAAEAQLPS